MNYSVLTVPTEDTMRKSKLKCICGDYATLQPQAKLGRAKDKHVTVFNVPVYTCSCGHSFMEGSDALKFSECVDRAIKNGQETISF